MKYTNAENEHHTENLSLYQMDCMELLKQTPDNYYDICICDPPYGGNDAINLKDCKNSTKQATDRSSYKEFENVEPPKEYFDELMRASKKQIIWGANFYKNVNLHGGRLVWDKKGTAFGRAEEAYLSMTKSVNIFEFTWNGMIQQNMKDKEKRIHSCQKPVKLYDFLLNNYAEKGQKILDTHLGSMSSAIACHYYGAHLTGCELDADYFKAGIERVEAETRQLTLL